MATIPAFAPAAAAALPPASSARTLQCGRYTLSLSRPLVMGILNVTPDSFFDGGRFMAREAALEHAQEMIAAGADLLDIGGESTRPGAPAVSLAEELERVVWLIDALRDAGVPLSIDTFKPAVMRAALDAGADMINDVRAFQEPGALEAVGAGRCAVCAMHMRGLPATMQSAPVYRDVVVEVSAFLDARVAALQAAGVAAQRICVDPGFGFGKTDDHNYALLAHLDMLAPPGVPLLAGMSRKSMLGAVTGRPVGERLAASVAAAVCAAERGASLLRVHDVAATIDALRVWAAVKVARPRPPHAGNAGTLDRS